jgi:hypothetical protein
LEKIAAREFTLKIVMADFLRRQTCGQRVHDSFFDLIQPQQAVQLAVQLAPDA